MSFPISLSLALSSSKVIGSNNHRDSVLYTYSNWELFPASSLHLSALYSFRMLLFIGYITNIKAERLSLNSSSVIFRASPHWRLYDELPAYYAVVLLKQSSLGIQGFIRAQCEIIQLKPIFNQLHVHNGTRKTDVLQWIPHRALLVTLGDIAMFYFIICFMLSCFKAVKGPLIISSVMDFTLRNLFCSLSRQHQCVPADFHFRYVMKSIY